MRREPTKSASEQHLRKQANVRWSEGTFHGLLTIRVPECQYIRESNAKQARTSAGLDQIC